MKKENVEDIVALLPMQQGFLWHSLQVDAASSALQLRCTFRGNICLDLLKRAWGEVVQKHQSLRSSIHWESVKHPIQVIHKQVPNDIALIDARSSPDTHGDLTELLEKDRAQAIDLTRAPAYRIVLFQTQEDTCEVIWTLSHVLLDGWSCAVVIGDWVKIYSNLLRGTEAAAAPGPLLREYARWIESQDKLAMLDYWDNNLPAETQLCARALQPADAPVSGDSQPGACQVVVTPEEFAALQHSLRSAGLSLGAVLQAAFATVLHARHSEKPVVFGTTVSGRQIDLPGIDSRVGMLTNLIPVCVEFDPGMSVRAWLQSIQARFFSALPHAHASMAEVLSLRPEQAALYDCLLVLENQPAVISTPELEVSDFYSGIISDFALTLIAVPENDLRLHFRYRREDFNHDDMVLLLDKCRDVLLAFSSSLSEPLSSLDQYKRTERKAGAGVPPRKIATNAEARANAEPGELATPVLEQKLREIWSAILRNDRIALDDDFFELGGTSLQAVMLFDQIEKQLGVRLPPITLFSAPTIAELATLVDSNQPDSLWSNIVGVNTSGSKIPLFIPFEQVDMLGYGPLCAELGPDQPVYGLKYPRDAARTDEFIETLVQHMETLHPEGPYQLAGLSGTGILAWRMAQKLQERGHEVSMLALLDSYGPAYPRLLPPFARLSQVAVYVAQVFASKARNALARATSGLSAPVQPRSDSRQDTQPQATFNEQQHQEFLQRVAAEHAMTPRFLSEVAPHHSLIDRTVNRMILALTQWRYHSNRLRIAYLMFIQSILIESCISMQKSMQGSEENGNDPLPISRSTLTRLPEDMTATRVNLERYLNNYQDLQPYRGPLVYFRAELRPPGVFNDPLAGWEKFIPDDANIYPIPGNHSSMLKRPNVQALAQHLKQEMKKTPVS